MAGIPSDLATASNQPGVGVNGHGTGLGVVQHLQQGFNNPFSSRPPKCNNSENQVIEDKNMFVVWRSFKINTGDVRIADCYVPNKRNMFLKYLSNVYVLTH